jgi:predicted Zn-dependent protease with MMP-like domain
MDRRRFERLVRQAYEGLPPEFLARIENVLLEIRDRPTRADLKSAGVPPGDTLLGLYEGVPLTERTPELSGQLPDRVTIFQRPIEEICRTDEEVIREVQDTVIHEYGHYFGLTDEEMEAIERGCR